MLPLATSLDAAFDVLYAATLICYADASALLVADMRHLYAPLCYAIAARDIAVVVGARRLPITVLRDMPVYAYLLRGLLCCRADAAQWRAAMLRVICARRALDRGRARVFTLFTSARYARCARAVLR